MGNLKILNTSSNEISKIDYLENLTSLKELDISKNKIRQIDPNSFNTQMQLICLKFEENGLKTLMNIDWLVRLQQLSIQSNRISEFWDVEKLENLPKLFDLNLNANPIVKKPGYRQQVLKRLLGIKVLDGWEVT